jgi:hypothetical protein
VKHPAHSNRAATPGLNPPGCERARTTGERQIASMPTRTEAGSDSHSTRAPSAGGAVIPRQPAARPCPWQQNSGRARSFYNSIVPSPVLYEH